MSQSSMFLDLFSGSLSKLLETSPGEAREFVHRGLESLEAAAKAGESIPNIGPIIGLCRMLLILIDQGSNGPVIGAQTCESCRWSDCYSNGRGTCYHEPGEEIEVRKARRACRCWEK